MQPQATPNAPVTPAPIATSPQGVASQAPVGAPVAPALPQAQAPVASPPPVAQPNFNTSGMVNQIANYYAIPRQTQALTGAGQAYGNVAQTNFEAQKAKNEITIQNNKDLLDPSSYSLTKNNDGSVTIINPLGQKVSIGQYASMTGANPAEALEQAGATDAASQKFIAAYNNLQTYIQDKIASANGDQQATIALGDFYKQNPGLQNMELGQLQSAFMQQYGSYFGQTTAPQAALNNPATSPLQARGVNPTLTSANSPMASSPYYEMEYYPQLATPNPITSSLLGGSSNGTAMADQLAQLQAQESANQSGGQ